MALQAKNAGNTSGKCTAGMVLSIIGIVLWIGALIFNIATGAFSTIMDSYS